MIRIRTISIGNEILDRFPMLSSPVVRFQIARELAEGARAYLIKFAGERLHSTRADYLAGIQAVQRDGKGVMINLVGALPNMVENGWDAHDLRSTLLGNNATGWKINADGRRYRSIPFRHKSPGAGPQGGQPMGSAYHSEMGVMSRSADNVVVEDSRKLGRKVYRAASRLVTSQESRAGMAGRTALKAGLAPKLRAHHSTDIYAGMKVNKQPIKGGGSQKTFVTFRTITEGGDGWIHPGIEARHFMDNMDKWIGEQAPKAIRAFMNEALKK